MLGSSTIGNAAPRLRTSFSVSVRSMPSIVTTNSTTPATMATSEMICGTDPSHLLMFSGIRRSTITTSRHCPSSLACFS